MTNISAPTASPSQNPRNPFPAWRLRNGVKNATDEELETSSESCERWGWRAGGLVGLGLVAELTIAIVHPPYDSFWDRWGGSLADFLVFVGVAGEVRFSQIGWRREKELTRRSNDRLSDAETLAMLASSDALRASNATAEANEELGRTQLALAGAIDRAAKAEQTAVEVMRDSLPRVFASAGTTRELLWKYRGSAVVLASVDDLEARRLCRYIDTALSTNGWTVLEADAGEIASDNEFEDGLCMYCEISIKPWLDIARLKAHDAADALRSCFELFNIEPILRPITQIDISSPSSAPFMLSLSKYPAGTIFIAIGPKPYNREFLFKELRARLGQDDA